MAVTFGMISFMMMRPDDDRLRAPTRRILPRRLSTWPRTIRAQGQPKKPRIMISDTMGNVLPRNAGQAAWRIGVNVNEKSKIGKASSRSMPRLTSESRNLPK